MTIIAVGDFTPDAPAYLSSNLPEGASNTYPRTDGSDGPLRGPVAVSSAAMPGDIRGGFAPRGRDGDSYVIAGNTTSLKQMAPTSWVARGDGYSVPEGGHWSFAQFGNLVIATNGFDPVQSWTLGSSASFAPLAEGAPLARYAAVVEPGFLMLGGIDSGDGFRGNAVAWSGINDATLWPTPGTTAALAAQSDEQELAIGGDVTGIVPAIGGAAAAIFSQKAIYRIDYVGPSAIFSFREVDRSHGCVCPNGIASVNGRAFFIAEDGFYAFDGTTVSPVGSGKVDRFFWRLVDRTQLANVYCTVDVSRQLIIWAFPSTGSAYANRWLLLNYSTGRWRYGDDAALAVSFLFPARSISYTLEELDALPAFQPDGIDTAGAPSLDSPLFIGGAPVMGGFAPSGALVGFDGDTLAALMVTGETDSSGKRVLVTALRPLTDADAAEAGVISRETFGGILVEHARTGMSAARVCPQRVSGRYVRGAIYIPKGTEWSYLQGVDATMRPEGRR